MTRFAGTARLVRLALRRDRITLPAWILGLGAFVAATTAMFANGFTDQAYLVQETRLVATNAGMRMLGITSGPSVGGYLLHREFVTLAVLAALLSTLAVVRHTRQNEEVGRAEMFSATVVGRSSALAAAVLVALLADVALAVVIGAAIALNGLPVAGSFLAGASVAGVGVAFVGVAAVTCQLTSTTRAATGLAAAVLGLSFLLSGVGNMTGTVDAAGLRVTSSWPAWLSPIGWGQQTRPFGGGTWWPIGLFVVLCAILLVLAASLLARRDVGRGMWPERRGRERAARGLVSPTGLAARLQRGAFVGWAVALTSFGLIFGSLTDQIADVKGKAAEWYTQTGGSDQVVDAFRASMVQMAAMFAAMYVVQVLLRMRVDEAGGTLEPVLATGVSRTRWVLGHLVAAIVGATALMLLFSTAMALASGRVLGGTATQLAQLTFAGLVQVPSALLVGLVVVLAVALVPRRATAVSWVVVVAALVLGPMFGPSLGLPRWLQDLSPFTHAPQAPATHVAQLPLVLVAGACVLVVFVGVSTIRRRDLRLPA